jgi:hypothetical protein
MIQWKRLNEPISLSPVRDDVVAGARLRF